MAVRVYERADIDAHRQRALIKFVRAVMSALRQLVSDLEG